MKESIKKKFDSIDQSKIKVESTKELLAKIEKSLNGKNEENADKAEALLDKFIAQAKAKNADIFVSKKAEPALTPTEKKKATQVVKSKLETLMDTIANDPLLKDFNNSRRSKGGGKSDPLIDSERKAIQSGPRVSKKGWKNQYGKSTGGRKYYEYRENRIDRKAPNYGNRPWLKEGGFIHPSDANADKYVVVEIKADGSRREHNNFGDLETARMFASLKREFLPKGSQLMIEDKDGKNLYRSFKSGGRVDESTAMVLSQNKAIAHHTEELKKAISKNEKVEPWVVGKMQRASTDISDVTHYFDGMTEYASGGMMADGGEMQNRRTLKFSDAVLYKDEMYEFVKKDGEVGFVSHSQGAWGMNGRFLPLGRMYRSDLEENLTDMYGNKFYIPNYEDLMEMPYSFAKGGKVKGGTLEDVRKDAKTASRNSKQDAYVIEDKHYEFANGNKSVITRFTWANQEDVDYIKEIRKQHLEGSGYYWPANNTWISSKIIGKYSDGELKSSEQEVLIGESGMMADGGEIEGVDLFEDYEDQPKEVKAILANYEMEDNDYETLQNLKAELESIGYTFDFGLDAEPYDLRKIGEKGKSEFYAKGGELDQKGADSYAYGFMQYFDKMRRIVGGNFGDDTRKEFEQIVKSKFSKHQVMKLGGMMADGGMLDRDNDAKKLLNSKKFDAFYDKLGVFKEEYTKNEIAKILTGKGYNEDGGLFFEIEKDNKYVKYGKKPYTYDFNNVQLGSDDIEEIERYLGNWPKATIMRWIEKPKSKPMSEDSYANGGMMADGGKVRWQDVYVGDNALVIAENKMGMVVKPYGRRFHLKFPDGSEKTYSAEELEFFKDEEFAKGGKTATGDYTNRRNLHLIVIKNPNKSGSNNYLTIDKKDFLDGLHKMEDGGSLSKGYTYIKRADVNQVAYYDKSGKLQVEYKPKNGFWVSKKALVDAGMNETKAKFNAQDVANELSALSNEAWDKLSIQSGSEIYASDTLQQDLADEYQKLGINKIYKQLTKAERKKVSDVLTDENEHSLRNYLALRGYNGEAEYKNYVKMFEEGKVKYGYTSNWNPKNVDLPIVPFAKGGSTSNGSKLPEEMDKYFIKPRGTKVISMSSIIPLRARAEGIANAEKNMKMAYEGKMEKRKPITLYKSQGKYRVYDGNSTYAVAKANGWENIWAEVIKNPNMNTYDKRGNDIFTKAKAIRKEGEAWKDALQRAKAMK